MARNISNDDKTTSLESLRVQRNVPSLAAGNSTPTSSVFQIAKRSNKASPPPSNIPEQFLLGSLTKAMTATLIALLVSAGLLSWDATLEDLLPSNPPLHPSHRIITLKDLTAHRSGLTLPLGLRPLFVYSFWDPALSPTTARTRAVTATLSTPAKFARGTFYYENINYIILGHIVDRLGDGPYESVITERLFKPLGMLDTGFGPRGDIDAGFEIPPPHLLSLFPGTAGMSMQWLPAKFHCMPPVMNPAGSVRCSLQDYNRFLRLHAGGGVGDGRLGLGEEDFAFLHRPWAEDDVVPRYTCGGWIRPREVDRREEGYSLCHSGANLFYNSHAKVDVGRGRGVCYMAMTNQMVGQGVCIEAVELMRTGRLNLE